MHVSVRNSGDIVILSVSKVIPRIEVESNFSCSSSEALSKVKEQSGFKFDNPTLNYSVVSINDFWLMIKWDLILRKLAINESLSNLTLEMFQFINLYDSHRNSARAPKSSKKVKQLTVKIVKKLLD